MGWVDEDGKHELYLAYGFADGSLSSTMGAGGFTIMDAPDGSPLPADDWYTRPAADVTGWVVCCNHYNESGTKSTTERLAEWVRMGEPDEEDSSAGRFYAPADAILDDRSEVEELMLDIWRQHLAPTNALSTIAAASEDLARATRALDQAVATGRAAGLTWAEIGRATGIARQSAHERWGRQ